MFGWFFEHPTDGPRCCGPDDLVVVLLSPRVDGELDADGFNALLEEIVGPDALAPVTEPHPQTGDEWVHSSSYSCIA